MKHESATNSGVIRHRSMKKTGWPGGTSGIAFAIGTLNEIISPSAGSTYCLCRDNRPRDRVPNTSSAPRGGGECPYVLVRRGNFETGCSSLTSLRDTAIL